MHAQTMKEERRAREGQAPAMDPDTARELREELACDTPLGPLFGISRQVFDRVWGALTSATGESVLYVSMEIGADPDVYNPVLDFLRDRDIAPESLPGLEAQARKHLDGPRKIPNYSGGLGVLAGDTLKSYADNRIPVAAVSLLYREGYFSQYVDSRVGQIDQATRWRPEDTPTLFKVRDPRAPDQDLCIRVPFVNEYDQVIPAQAEVWCKLEINARRDYFVPEFLLDYDIEASPPWVREAGRRLYDARSQVLKANQRRLLGVSILPLMRALGLTAHTIHLNEQHGVNVALQLINEDLQQRLGEDFAERATDEDILEAARRVSRHLVYTIHTPVKAGHDRFNRAFYSGLSLERCRRILDLLARDEEHPEDYNFTALAMRVNRSVNAVSRLHRDVTRRQFPRYARDIKAITNGVHHLTWISPHRAALFDRTDGLQGWREDPGVFARAGALRSQQFRQDLRQAWKRDNEALIGAVNQMLRRHRAEKTRTWIDPPNYLSRLERDEGRLRPGVLCIGFARRFSTYKRADLIFDDLDRLAGIFLERGRQVNFLFAGKAHPADEPGKSVLKLILDNQEDLYRKSRGLVRLVFIPGYDMALARLLTAGVHAWLNSPKRPLEASGTSGMKAAVNGVPNISIMDGWWVEGYHNGRTGWKFGHEGPVDEAVLDEDPASLLYAEDAESFYRLLPSIVDAFYGGDQEVFMNMAVNNLQLNLPVFNTHRMGAEYVREYGLALEPETRRKVEYFQTLYRSDPGQEASGGLLAGQGEGRS